MNNLKRASLAALTAATVALPLAAHAQSADSGRTQPPAKSEKGCCASKCRAKAHAGAAKCGAKRSAKCSAKCGAKCGAKCAPKCRAKCAPKS